MKKYLAISLTIILIILILPMGSAVPQPSTILDQNPQTIDTHDYLCIEGIIYECCGSSSNTCNSLVAGEDYGGQRITSGQSPITYGEDHFYTTNKSEADNADTNLNYAYEGVNGIGYVYISQQSGTVFLYRLYKPNQDPTKMGDHFYTTDQAEADNADINLGYHYEPENIYILPSPPKPTNVTLSITEDSVEVGQDFHASWSASGNIDHYEFNWHNESTSWQEWEFVSNSAQTDYPVNTDPWPLGVYSFAIKACADPEGDYCTSSFPDTITLNSATTTYTTTSPPALQPSTPQTKPLYRLANPTTGNHFYTTNTTEKDTAVASGYYSDEGIAGYIYSSQESNTVPFYRLYWVDPDAYTCTDEGKWITGIASITSQPGNTTQTEYTTKEDCESNNFKWTSSKCCGDTSNEYYNDADYGCWNSSTILSGEFPTTTQDVMNYFGQFYGCKLDATNYITSNDNLIDLKDTTTNGSLIENKDFCEAIAGDSYYYCDYTEEWTQGTVNVTLSTVPWVTTLQEEGCCPENKCFNASECVDNQAGDPSSSPHNGDYRCIDGTWQASTLLSSMDDDGTTGYCPEPGQCLVSLAGDSSKNNDTDSNPQCIANEQYIEDNYCEDGTWSSRTKLIALQLLDIPSGDYILFCGDYESALNNFDYIVKDSKNAQDYITDKTNNYCILIYDTKVVFGTTLNQEINTGDYEFTDVIDTDCDGALDDNGKYNQCTTDKAWYNEKFKSIIYSNYSISLSDINFADQFLNFFKNPFSTLVNNLNGTITPPYDQSFVEGLKKFNRLYMNKKGTKSISGVLEGSQFKNLVLEYKNFNTDICTIIADYNGANNDSYSGIVCNKDGTNHNILAQGSTFTTLDPATIWLDLTAKLRIT